MPIFSYFSVVGSVLLALLLLLGNGREPIDTRLPTSQTVGVPKFKSEPETEHARVTAVNFAAAFRPIEIKSVRLVEARPRPKSKAGYSKTQPLSQLAEFPHSNLSIH
jgi:hypothetical protein